MDFVRRWSDRTEIPARRFIAWLEVAASKFYEWRRRYGKVNEQNSWIPRREDEIFAERDRKLEAARELRKARRQSLDIAQRQRDYGAQTGSRAPEAPSAARAPLTQASTVVQ